MTAYLFDVKLFASVTIEADDEASARANLDLMFNVADVHVSDPDNDDVDLTFECSVDGDADLIEVNGEPVA